jgi:hypothetical protein
MCIRLIVIDNQASKERRFLVSETHYQSPCTQPTTELLRLSDVEAVLER